MSNEAVATRKDIDEVIGIVKDFMQAVDTRFENLENRQQKIEDGQQKLEAGQFSLASKVDSLEQRIDSLQASHDRLMNTIDRFIARINGYETEQIARDHQFEKLLNWARKVSAKTGIPLENL